MLLGREGEERAGHDLRQGHYWEGTTQVHASVVML